VKWKWSSRSAGSPDSGALWPSGPAAGSTLRMRCAAGGGAWTLTFAASGGRRFRARQWPWVGSALGARVLAEAGPDANMHGTGALNEYRREQARPAARELDGGAQAGRREARWASRSRPLERLDERVFWVPANMRSATTVVERCTRPARGSAGDARDVRRCPQSFEAVAPHCAARPRRRRLTSAQDGMSVNDSPTRSFPRGLTHVVEGTTFANRLVGEELSC